MEANRIEESIVLRAGHKKTDIAKQVNVCRMTIHRVPQYLSNSESLPQ